MAPSAALCVFTTLSAAPDETGANGCDRVVSGVGVLAGAWDDQELPGKMDNDSFRRLPGDDVLCGGRGNDGL